MAVTPKLLPTVKAGLTLTPQLQQTIALIQKSNAELVDLVRQEINENPALEENIGPDPDAQMAAAEDDAARGMSSDSENSQDDWGPDDWERFREYLQTSSGVRGATEIGRAAPIDNILVNQETLASHLIMQIGERLNSEKDIRICEAIIGNLNDSGYLDATLEEIKELGDGDWSLADIENGLMHIQTLDPKGVGARDERECLLLQIGGEQNICELVEILVREHYESCETMQSDDLARKLGVVVEKVQSAIEFIGSLDKAPGLSWVAPAPEYLIPDVKVIEEEGDYRVEFIDQNIPRVIVNRNFMPISEKADDEKFRKEKLESARNLMKAIDQRKKTIMKVTDSIVQYQKEFMDVGPHALRPLVLREIADEIGMHESTVSRVVHNKAIDTPHGVFELKMFFPTKIPCRNGDDVSSVVVKFRIRDIIQNEDRRKPLSDSKIHAFLQEDGYILARRTVAKYREELRLPMASQRRVVS